MLGIIIQLFISWLLLWYFDKSNLSALGLAPSKKRMIAFVVGLVLAASTCAVYNLLTTAFVNNGWLLNRQLTVGGILSGTRWVFKSVLFEELLFRGALLYLLMKRLGISKACIISATCFGIYHWFSFNAFGNPVVMLIIFLLTGIFGLLLAYAFARTKSMYLPVALHFGWNWVHIVVFSNGPLGKQIFYKMNENNPQGATSLFIFLFQMVALPLLGFLYINKFAKQPSKTI